MYQVRLPALDGRTPLGFLAAMGVLRMLTGSGLDARVAWDDATLTPTLHNDALPDVDSVTEVLQALVPGEGEPLVPGMPAGFPPPGEAPDGLRVPPRDLRRLVVGSWDHAVGGGAARDWVRALVTDLVVSEKGACSITLLAAPSGKQSFSTMFEKTTALTRSRPTAIREALVGWRRVDGYTGEYLDHRVLRDAADASDGKPRERGVPGATWLALMAFPWLPVTANQSVSQRSGVGWQRVRRGFVFRWPLWRPPLDAEGVRCLLDHPALVVEAQADGGGWVLPREESARLGRLGVLAVGLARRTRLPGRNFDGVLTPEGILAIPSSDGERG